MAAEAKNERVEMLREASRLKEKIIEDAKTQATAEANKIIENAKESIQLEKDNAVKEIVKILLYQLSQEMFFYMHLNLRNKQNR